MASQDAGVPRTPLSASSQERPTRSGRIRVTRACDRCKKRKVRCTGQQPCRLCSESSAVCSYNASYSRGRRPARPGPSPGVGSESTALYPAGNGFESQPDPHRTGVPVDELISPASPEPTQTDLEGHYVGPSSGISFLSRVQKRLEESVSFSRGLSVFNFGDAPLAYQSGGYSTPVDAQPGLDLAMFFLLKREDTTRLVARYFDFAVPLDRFLHRPTVEKWLDEFYETKGRMHSKEAAPAQTAVLFIVFAVAQEHSSPKLSAEEADMSVRYFRAANHQLSREQGAVRLASVQARLCQCLWLLSQSRINHCWSLFGTVARLALALGLHRKRHPNSASMTAVDIECRRRTFWSAYSLDNYLSAALGRPRTFNDKDIDQELPSCVDDEDIMGSSLLASGPSASVMYGPIAYAKLSRILSGILSDIYSIQPMTITQRLAHTTQYMKEIKSWRSSMSPFLSQHDLNAPPLIPIYQRQRNMLSLAYWHTVILTNRPLLLTSFAKLTDGSRSRQLEQSERKADIDESILECLHAALEIIKIVDAMIQGKLLFRAYWFTPYLTFSACVILYAYTIQHSKERDDVYKPYFAAAERCRQHIVDIAEEGSLTSRYSLVLEELREVAVRQMRLAHAPEQAQPAMVTSTAEFDALTAGVDMSAAGFDASILTALEPGHVDIFQESPGNSLENLTNWITFSQ